jgi:hypothetical protein
MFGQFFREETATGAVFRDMLETYPVQQVSDGYVFQQDGNHHSSGYLSLNFSMSRLQKCGSVDVTKFRGPFIARLDPP